MGYHKTKGQLTETLGQQWEGTLASFLAIQFDENARRIPNEVRWRPSKLSMLALYICFCSLFLFPPDGRSAEDQSASGQVAATDVPPSSAVELPTERSLFHVFLLMGQSNMAGYGCIAVGDTCPPNWNDPVPHVLVLDGQSLIDSAVPQQKIEWRAGSQPLHLGQPLTARYGLGMDFAKAYSAAHPGLTIGLIPCAWGGAPIDRLNQGTADYDNCMVRAKYAAKTGTIMGVLWHQGESDTVTPDLADSYANKLDMLVRSIRKNLNIASLIFVAGDLAEFYGTSPEHNAPLRLNSITTVRIALSELPYRVPCTGFVSSAGLKSADEHYVHFNQPSYAILGRRYAQTVLGIQNLYRSACQ